MLKVDFKNIFEETVGGNKAISKCDVQELESKVPAAHEKIQDWRKSEDAIFYDYIFRDDITAGIAETAEKIASNFENVIVLGIGGSALGLRCAAQSLLPPFWNMLGKDSRKGKPRLFVCDNIDSDSFAALMQLVDIAKSCFIVISKSGKTTETAAQFFIVASRLKKLLGQSWSKNLVIITDPKSGELRPMVEKEGITSFAIPPKLGGRFSVLSPVGLFPAACVGIDIENLVAGAREMAKRCCSPDLKSNPAYALGGYHYILDTEKKMNISVMMPYSDALSLASDWYVQLWAESLGKAGRGQTPVKALGATDQHSQVQLYMEGPSDKVFTFLYVEKFSSRNEETIVEEPSEAFSYIKERTLSEILNAECEATIGALTKMNRPSMKISFPNVDALHLGEFFMLYQIATAFAGALYGINPFDQPGVELGKILTREILTKR
ncbi:MAG: Glucose-6-phosphate isomerase [bacterium ADurb.Bin270]|jgi:glucose-6-phosphate isomerase|nr:MAG: Glucose-6-phosphate isomerase [bacterium ADurb.Bin270]HQH80022.1 glucose-6-phosphate isomerase [bacterium]